MDTTDATGHKVQLLQKPTRIVSLVPSQTELLFDLGLESEVVGITQFCVHPKEWFQEKTKIGGTKKLKFDRIKDLKPDLILANKEENNKEDILLLQESYPVYTTNIKDLEDSFAMIDIFGQLTDTTSKATEIAEKIRIEKRSMTSFKEQKSGVYIIWQNPTMTVGGDTYISNMMELAGYKNCFQAVNRYPVITEKDILSMKPDVIFLSSEPFPFKEKDVQAWQLQFKSIPVVLVDGEMFSWYGSRIKHSFGYFETLNKNLRSLF